MAAEAPISKRSRRTRTELGRAAHDEVARSGAIDVAAISSAAGVSPATFYAHFDTHDDALAAALDLSLRAVIRVSNELFRIENLLERGVESVVEQMVREVVAAFGVEAFVMRAALARLPHHRGIRAVYRHHETTSRDHLARHIELGQKAGLLRAGDPAPRATSLLVLTQGLNNPLLLGGRPSPVVIDDLCRSALALLLP
ncbi:MAG: TetR family transcriptional regulator [Actinomycetia bacterium]|nr:TetR family transcriptional regulator [Actinomycetes bacterium]MCP4086978.1 TetR family transcriptional regulator [Actinomycetes bacterium]